MDAAPLPELRLEARNNIFVMAALYAEGRPVTPVRVRNMSHGGALVEAADLPEAGALIRLSRATLSASGEVVWADEHRAGLRFSAPVSVAEWLPLGRRGGGQQLIDELAHRKRLGKLGSSGTGSIAPVEPTVEDELTRLKLLLFRAAEDLALDGGIAARHLMSLQLIDGVAQSLGQMATTASRSEPRPAAA